MRRMTLIATAILCVAVLSAAAAPDASAAETTIYTCVETEPGIGEFENPHCDPNGPSEGKNWGHIAISAGETTQLTLKRLKNPVLISTIGLATVELEGTEVECIGCHFTNSGSVGAMKASGEGGTVNLTGLIARKLGTKCEVHAVGNAAAHGVVESRPLKFETIGTHEVRFDPAVGNVLAEFEITPQPGQKCPIAGKLTLTGFFVGTTSGSTLTINVTLGSGDLQLSGEPASVTTELTLSGGPTGAEHHPLALT